MRIVLEDARENGADQWNRIPELVIDGRFLEIQDGWISVWGGDDEMPVVTWMIEAGGLDPVRVWSVDGGDIHNDNWKYESSRVSVLP